MKQTRYLCSLFLCLLFLAGCQRESAAWESVQPSTHGYETEAAKRDEQQVTEQIPERRQVTVHVCGAVECPGVYTLTEGARLVEAVEMAGGFREDADTDWCNQARQIADQEQIVIYTAEETAAMKEQGQVSADAPAANASGVSESTDGDKVNLNTASLEQLMSLPGIGASRAQAILEYRESQGGFASIEEVMQIGGIKSALFEKMKDRITV